jgi:predicted NUDIX family NTP pyrophosphohydrolase
MSLKTIPNKTKYIKSYGILCFNVIKDELKVLLVKRKYTYEFLYFVTSNQDFNKTVLIKLFNKMTIEEKRLIQEFNFDLLWNKLWYEKNSFNNIIYHKTKKRYEEFIEKNKNNILVQLNTSCNLKDNECHLWSLPKGRKNYSDENKYIVAIREFTEETGIPKSNYFLDFHFKRKYILENKYKIKYFIAIYKNNFKVSLKLTNIKLMSEVNGIEWFSLDEIHKECNYLYDIIKPAFTYIRNNSLIL